MMIPTHVLMYIATLMALLVAPCCVVWYSAKKNAAAADDTLVSSQKNQAADADPDNNWAHLFVLFAMLLVLCTDYD